MVKVLGITGGIGAGKSFVCRVFESLGCKIYDSDSRTKQLYDENPALLSALVEILGKGILKNGRLDRSAMASVIFSDKEKMEKVKELVYPYVMEDFRLWKKWKRGVVLLESAVILENEYVRSFVDKTLVITAPLQVRIERVMRRDGVSRAQVEERLASQCSDEERIKKADFVIETFEGADLHFAAKQVLEKINRS